VWEKEAREWGFDPVILKAGDKPHPKKFNICSYNAMISSKLHPALMQMKYDLLGGDESDAFKNKDAKRTKSFYGTKLDGKDGLISRAGYVWVMTGTPMLNNPSELYPMLRAMFPDAIMNQHEIPLTYWSFVNRYCTTVDNGFGIKITGGKNLAKLREQLRGRTMRRTKEQVWEDWKLPIVDLLPVSGTVTGIPSNEMDAVRNALASNDINDALRSVAEQTPTLRRLTGLAKVAGVVDWIDDNVEACGKIIVFAHHKEVITALKAKLKHKYVEIIGGMSSEQKYAAYTAFQDDPSVTVFIGQNQAARDSIPLWKASTTISIEPDWVPGNNDQMLDRMTHFSKKEPCVAYYATLRGSIDEDIQKANIRKREITSELGLN
jgi:SWI/SNF-related matrix-associated actin-dependent regulator 1 of chromatin subfamily A